MADLPGKKRQPALAEIGEYIGNPLYRDAPALI